MTPEQYPVLIVLCPFLVALIASLSTLVTKKLVLPLSLAALFAAVVAAINTLTQVFAKPGHLIEYKLGGWTPPVGIGYAIDPLNAVVLVVITGVALITAIYAKAGIEREMPNKVPQFYILLLLLTTGLCGMTITQDAFNLYVLLEISSLSSYGLIAMGRGRAPLAAFNYIIMGTIGASFYLLGVGYLYIKTGSLNMVDIARILQEEGLFGSETILVGFILMLVGVWIKMAFFPLHQWLPNAYTFAPSASSAIIAPLMTKVSVYIMIRMMFTIFTPEYVFVTLHWDQVIVWFAVIAIIAGSLFALAQKDLKKMLAYLIVAEVGYMVGGAWLANANGLTGAIFHIIADALMTLCLFLFTGIVVYQLKDQKIKSLKGVFKKMPFTMAGFTLGALSMIGIPPTCGFFSKWYLISGGIEAGHWGYVVALLFSSLINAFLFFRIIEHAYFGQLFLEGEAHGHHSHTHHQKSVDEAPLSMLLPFLAVATGLLVLGLYSSKVIEFISLFVKTTGLS